MNVILVGPIYPYRGGIAHHTQFLDQAFQELGHPTQIISFHRQYPAWLYPGSSDKDPSQKEKPVNASYILDPLYPWIWRQAARKIIASQPDLVVIQWWTTFWSLPFAYLARRLQHSRIPTVYLIHNVIPHEPLPWDSWLARLALAPATAFLAQTEAEKERLLDLLPNARIRVQAHPAYPLANAAPFARAEARNRIGLPEDQPILLFFGLVRAYKGLGDLLEALGILHQQNIHPHLVIAGEFWGKKANYLAQIAHLKIDAQVHIYGYYIPDEEVGDFFSAADLFVAPYTTGATQSGSANIARGMGLPMIVTEEVFRGLDHKPDPGITVVPSNDPTTLAQAIKAYLACPPPNRIAAVDVNQEWRHFAEKILHGFEL